MKKSTLLIIIVLLLITLYLLCITTGTCPCPLQSGVKTEELSKELRNSYIKGESEQTKKILSEHFSKEKEKANSSLSDEEAENMMKEAGNLISVANKDVNKIKNDTLKKETKDLANRLDKSIKTSDERGIFKEVEKVAEAVNETKKKANKVKEDIDNLHTKSKDCKKRLRELEQRNLTELTDEEKIEITELRDKCPEIDKDIEEKENEYSDLQETLKILSMLCRVAGSVAMAFGHPEVGAALFAIAFTLESEANNFEKKATDGNADTEPTPGSPEPDYPPNQATTGTSEEESLKQKDEIESNDPNLVDYAEQNKPDDSYDLHLSEYGNTSNIYFYSSMSNKKFLFKKMDRVMAEFEFKDINLLLDDGTTEITEAMLPAQKTTIKYKSFEKDTDKLSWVSFTAKNNKVYSIYRTKIDSNWELQIVK